MCVSTGGGFARVLNPLGLPLNVIDPGGSLVNMAVKATGIGGAPGAILRGASGLEGTITESKNFYNKTYNPKQASPTDPALQGANPPPQNISGFGNIATGVNTAAQGGAPSAGSRSSLNIPTTSLPPGQTSSGLFIPQG